jgi:hypothetical protein
MMEKMGLISLPAISNLRLLLPGRVGEMGE